MAKTKMYTVDYATGWESTSTPPVQQTVNRFPALLQGEELRTTPLALDFDTTVHQKAQSAGVKATSLSEMRAMIEALRQRKRQVG